MYDLPILLIDRVISPVRKDFIFTKRSFTKIKPSRKFPNLQYFTVNKWLYASSRYPFSRANHTIYRGSYISARVLLNLLNELRKIYKMRGLPSISSFFCNEFNKFNDTGARMLDSIYHYDIKMTLKSYFWR